MIKTKCDSVNHTRFPKEDQLPYWARRDNKITKGDRVEKLGLNCNTAKLCILMLLLSLRHVWINVNKTFGMPIRKSNST